MARSESDFDVLIERLRRGDDEAARQIVHTYGRHVIAVLRRRLNRHIRVRLDSQDLAQAVWQSFFVGIRGIANVRSEGQLIALLIGMTENKLRDAYRHEVYSRRRGVFDEGDAVMPSDDGPRSPKNNATPSQFAMAHELWESMLRGRSAIQQQVVNLRLKGETFRGIAMSLGISERTARRLIDDLVAVQQERLESEAFDNTCE